MHWYKNCNDYLISEIKNKMKLLYSFFAKNILIIQDTVEPRYKEVGYNKKPSYNKVILWVPALYISLFFYPDIMRNLI